MKEAFERLARSLADAWRTGKTVPLPPAEDAPASRADAFALQDRMAEAIGDRCVGWKVGAAVRAVQIMEGHDGPIVGRLLAQRVYDSPGQVPWDLFDGCKIESEFAFRFRAAVPVRAEPWTRAELTPLIEFHPGLEIAGTRFTPNTGGRKVTTRDAIADNGTGGGYVVGSGIADWQGIDFAGMPIEARIDGGEPLHTYTGEFRRDAVDILVETVNGLSERGIGMAAGDLLSTGSLTLPTLLRRGQTYTARFGDLMTVSVAAR